MTWIHELIGKPWKAGARGPEAYDCLGLVYHVMSTQFGIQMDDGSLPNPKSIRECIQFGLFETSKAIWHRVRKPAHGDVVAMSRGKIVHHVGVWVDIDRGKVLHSMDFSNVVAHSLQELSSIGINTVLFYRHESLRTSH